MDCDLTAERAQQGVAGDGYFADSAWRFQMHELQRQQDDGRDEEHEYRWDSVVRDSAGIERAGRTVGALESAEGEWEEKEREHGEK